MKLKAGVKLSDLCPQMVLASIIVERAFERAGHDCIVTSANDSGHGWGSLHFHGNAVDYRTKHIPDDKLEAIVNEIDAALTDEFDVLFEDDGEPNEHLHIEYQPKRAR